MAKVWFTHAEQLFLYYSINIWKRKLIIDNYLTLPGWPTCACSYGKFPSHLGGIPGKSSEIPPKRTCSLLTWKHYIFYSFFNKVRSHLGKSVRLTVPAHLHMNSPFNWPNLECLHSTWRMVRIKLVNI